MLCGKSPRKVPLLNPRHDVIGPICYINNNKVGPDVHTLTVCRHLNNEMLCGKSPMKVPLLNPKTWCHQTYLLVQLAGI